VSNAFAMTFTALPRHIDELGHVNNSVWVQWIQAVATAHWEALAPPELVATHVWVVTRHEIDYRGNIGPGESVTAETSIPGPPRGAQFDRRVVFRSASGKAIVSALSTWALLDRASGRLCRVRPEIAAPFYAA
jgi:acyl-CoA thioester hydrolase